MKSMLLALVVLMGSSSVVMANECPKFLEVIESNGQTSFVNLCSVVGTTLPAGLNSYRIYTKYTSLDVSDESYRTLIDQYTGTFSNSNCSKFIEIDAVSTMEDFKMKFDVCKTSMIRYFSSEPYPHWEIYFGNWGQTLLFDMDWLTPYIVTSQQ